jgi:hypothetical protein
MELNVMMYDDLHGVTAASGISICYGGYMKQDLMSRAVGTHREKRNAYGVLVGRSGEKKLLGGLRCGWEINIKVYL